MSDKRSLRAFLAADPPAKIVDEIVRIEEHLKKTIKGDMRWVRPEGIHLTLKFFGNIYESDIANICQVVKDKTVSMRPLTLFMGRLGAFPTTTRPRVLWLGIDGDVEELINLQKEIDAGLMNHGFGKDERPFKPHLTLSRIKEPKGLTGVAEAIGQNEDYTAGSFTVDGLSLFKSDLKPTGAVYTKLAHFPFPG